MRKKPRSARQKAARKKTLAKFHRTPKRRKYMRDYMRKRRAKP